MKTTFMLSLFNASLLCAQVPMQWQSLTPQPERIEGVAKPSMSLNGTWQFSTTADAAKKPCEVPGEWAMQGFSVPEGEAAIYEKTVTIPADWAGMQARVRFDSVHAECEIFFDGAPIGEHKGGFVPFEVALPATAPGEHILRLLIKSESISDTLSTISQYASHQVGGILRDATLFCLPPAHLETLRIETRLPGDVIVRCTAVGRATLILTLKDGDQVVAKQIHGLVPHPFVIENEDEIAQHIQTAPTDISAVLKVDNPKLWTNETPHLYTLTWELFLKSDRPIEKGSQRVGIREVRVEGNQLFINDRPVKLFGVNRHEVHPLLGRATTKELAWQDARLFKEANMTCIRTSHYPPSPHFLEACDELGLFVESEAALCWIQHHANPVWRNGWDYLDKKYLPYMLGANLDHIRAYANHPSIILWSLGNESQWSPLWAEVNVAVKAADPTRPTVFHDQCWGGFNNAGSQADIANHHYPSEANSHMWSEKGKPVWFGEYAHVQCYNRRELETDPGIREDWGRPLARMVDLMWQQPGSLGGTIWCGIDDVFHMPDGTIKGYGHWGVIDAWRRKKPEYDGVKNAYSPIHFTFSKLPSVSGEIFEITIQNRHNFKTLNYIFEYQFGNAEPNKQEFFEGVLEPHAFTTHSITAPTFKDDTLLTVSLWEGRGSNTLLHKERYLVSPRKEQWYRGQAFSIEENAGFKLWSLKLPAPVPFLLPLNGEGGASGPAGTVLSADIAPFTPIEPFEWEKSTTPNHFTGENNQVKASLAYTPLGTLSPAGESINDVRVDYTITSKVAMNPRQWGLAFTFPKAFKQMAWYRETHGKLYAEDQIGRESGEAISFNPGPIRLSPEERKARESHPWFNPPGGFDSPRYQYPDPNEHNLRKAPTTPWYHDCTALGPADFRATKRDIRSASLKSDDDDSFVVTPVDPAATIPAVRAWVDGDCIRLLVAGFNTGGSDGFFATHYAAERRPIKPGDELKGSFTIKIAR